MGGFLFFCAVVANSHTERYRILQEEEADDGDEEGYYPQNRLDEAELDESDNDKPVQRVILDQTNVDEDDL